MKCLVLLPTFINLCVYIYIRETVGFFRFFHYLKKKKKKKI
jgi:hypothetical protein